MGSGALPFFPFLGNMVSDLREEPCRLRVGVCWGMVIVGVGVRGRVVVV